MKKSPCPGIRQRKITAKRPEIYNPLQRLIYYTGGLRLEGGLCQKNLTTFER